MHEWLLVGVSELLAARRSPLPKRATDSAVGSSPTYSARPRGRSIAAARVVHHSEHRGDVAIIGGQRLSLHALTHADPPYAWSTSPRAPPPDEQPPPRARPRPREPDGPRGLLRSG